MSCDISKSLLGGILPPPLEDCCFKASESQQLDMVAHICHPTQEDDKFKVSLGHTVRPCLQFFKKNATNKYNFNFILDSPRQGATRQENGKKMEVTA